MILWTYLLIKEPSWFYITSQNVVIPFDLLFVELIVTVFLDYAVF